MSFDFYDVVRVDGPLAPDEIRGRSGYLCGRGEGDEEPVWGGFVYDLAEVWCVDTGALVALGYRGDIARNRKPAAPIRVSVDGDVLD
jgi:hypothetical protein